MKRPNLTLPQICRIEVLREREGKSYREIGEILGGVDEGAVQWCCLAQGFEKPGKVGCTKKFHELPGTMTRNGHVVRNYSPEEDELLLKLEATGIPLSEVARQMPAPGRKRNSVLARLYTLARHDVRAEAAVKRIKANRPQPVAMSTGVSA